MNVELQQKGTFEASHMLRMMPDGHMCRRLHGHRYEVTVAISGDVELCSDNDCILLDYLDLEARLKTAMAALDHRHLNDISEGAPYFCQPTVEWLGQPRTSRHRTPSTRDWKLATGKLWVETAARADVPCHIGRAGGSKTAAWARRIGADSIDSCLPLFSRENCERFKRALASSQLELWNDR